MCFWLVSPARGGGAWSSPQEAGVGLEAADFGILRVLERRLDLLGGVLPVPDRHRQQLRGNFLAPVLTRLTGDGSTKRQAEGGGRPESGGGEEKEEVEESMEEGKEEEEEQQEQEQQEV